MISCIVCYRHLNESVLLGIWFKSAERTHTAIVFAVPNIQKKQISKQSHKMSQPVSTFAIHSFAPKIVSELLVRHSCMICFKGSRYPGAYRWKVMHGQHYRLRRIADSKADNYTACHGPKRYLLPVRIIIALHRIELERNCWTIVW